MWWKILAAYVLGALVIGLVIELVESGDQQRYGALASSAVRTTGDVTSYNPANHNDLEYEFEVNGFTYKGGGSSHYQGSFSVGQSVTVVYEPENPSDNCACDPRMELANVQQFPVVGGLLLAVMIPVIYLGVRGTLLRRPPAKATAPPTIAPGIATQALVAGRRTWTRARLPRWLWSGGDVVYDVGEPAASVASRLAKAVRSEGLLDSLVAPGQLRGWVQGSRFNVTLHLPLISNSFNSIVDGQIFEAPGGCRVIGRLKLRTMVVVFFLVWMALATLMGAVIMVFTLASPRSWSPSPPPLAFGLLFPAGGIGVLAICRLIARPQERALVTCLDAVIGAT